MKIFVISDTHGKTDKVIEVWYKLSNVDLVIHLGDYEKDAKYLEKVFETEVISVKGNMDCSRSKDDYEILETEYAIEDYANAIAKDNTELLDAVNAALKKLTEDGTIDAIISKYIAAE